MGGWVGGWVLTIILQFKTVLIFGDMVCSAMNELCSIIKSTFTTVIVCCRPPSDL